jgi:hypothetical protein
MTTLRLSAALACLAAAGCAGAPPAPVNDFPTVERVVYVQDCLRANPGPAFEMINKCSCAVDRLAQEVRWEQFVELQTVANAVSIGGERGGELRDNETLKPAIKRYRDLQAQVQKACMIGGR